MPLLRRLLLSLSYIILTAVVAVVIGAILLTASPGHGIDEQQLDPTLSATFKAQEQAKYAEESRSLPYLVHHASRLVRLDFGDSRTLNRPVRQLLGERAAVSLRLLGWGLLTAWICGLLLAILAELLASRVFTGAAFALTAALLCIPSALIALLCVVVRGPVPVVLAIVLFPKIFRLGRSLFAGVRDRGFVLNAFAQGCSKWRVITVQMFTVILKPLLSVFGSTVSIALSAMVPIEVITDTAGWGQLTWHAAEGRDLPLLLGTTTIVAIATVAANSLCRFEWQPVLAPGER